MSIIDSITGALTGRIEKALVKKFVQPYVERVKPYVEKINDVLQFLAVETRVVPEVQAKVIWLQTRWVAVGRELAKHGIDIGIRGQLV